jgi:hypothetical protein
VCPLSNRATIQDQRTFIGAQDAILSEDPLYSKMTKDKKKKKTKENN